MAGRSLAAAVAACGLLVAVPATAARDFSLRFFGHGTDDADRVKIRIDDPAQSADPGPPVDVGSTDFTIEFWMKARASNNVPSQSVTCNAPNIDWIYGNIVFDRDRFNQDRKYGISIHTGRVMFGVSGDGTGDYTICSSTSVLDDTWRHVAVQRRRSDGRMSLFVDGVFQIAADGPDGDISYPDDGVPGNFCGGPCTNSDPFLVIGAEKHDADPGQFPSYNGWLDEVRYSDTLRYPEAGFDPPEAPFATDADTVALYDFNEGPPGPCDGVDAVLDGSGASGGPSNGDCSFGGSPSPPPEGPLYDLDSPFGLGPIPSAPSVGRLLLGIALLAGAAFVGRRAS